MAPTALCTGQPSACAEHTCSSLRTRSTAPGWQVQTASHSALVSTNPRRLNTFLFKQLQLYSFLRAAFAELQARNHKRRSVLVPAAAFCLSVRPASGCSAAPIPVVVQLHQAGVVVVHYLCHQNCSNTAR